MNASGLLTYLRERGVELSGTGDRLHIDSPRGVITDELRAALREHKQELLVLLNGKAPATDQAKDELVACSLDEAHPLSYAQQRFWMLQALDPEAATYNVFNALRISSAVDADAMRRAVEGVANRHKVFTSRCVHTDDGPLQQMNRDNAPLWQISDLRHLDACQRESQCNALIAREAARPFDLEQDPLLRAGLIVLDDNDHVLLLTTHHFAADGWSMQILAAELFAMYAAFTKGLQAQLADLPLQYVDFAHWQRRQLEGPRKQILLDYWSKQLADAPALLNLPTDRPRPSLQDHRGASVRFQWPESLYQSLAQLSRARGVTLFTTLLAGFQTMLHRYSGDDDLLVGVAVSERGRSEFEPVIGPFGNNVVCRARFADNPTFRELLDRTRDVVLGALSHQDLPFELLLESLQPPRNPGYSPVFQSMFVLHHALDVPTSSSDSAVTEVPVEVVTSMFDLSMDVAVRGGELGGFLEFRTDLFDRATVERMIDSMQRILESAAADPELKVGELPVLGDAERALMLETWNDTATDAPAHANVAQWFSATARTHNEATAVSMGEQRLSYTELERRANRLTHHLIANGVKRGTLVGLCLERSVELPVAILAVLKAGAAYVPLESSIPAARLQLMLADTGIDVLVSKSPERDALPAFNGTLVLLDNHAADIAARPSHDPGVDAGTQALAYVVFTSGSTGIPKGVEVPAAGLLNHLHWMLAEFPLGPGDCVAQQHAFGFDVASMELLTPLLAGATLAVVPPSRHFDVEELVTLMIREKVTAIDLVPSVLESMLDDPRINECKDLRRVTCGGESLPADLARRCLDTLEIELGNLYGPAEATIGSTWWRCDLDTDLRTVPIGRPIHNTQVYLLDRRGQPVPVGVTAEIHIGGIGVARGYLNQPELTAERFVPDPFSSKPYARLYRTGDLGRFHSDGAIEFLGRVDHQVKINGVRIEPGEVETQLREHPDILDAVVLAEARGKTASAEDLASALGTLDPTEAQEMLLKLEELDESEAHELLGGPAKSTSRSQEVLLRKNSMFELRLDVQSDTFAATPRASQRTWMLHRAMDEFSDDLQHLEVQARRVVTGSERPVIQGEWHRESADYDESLLLIDEQQVMQDWETPLIRAMADIVGKHGGDVLEIGFGMGISAGFIQEHQPRSHTIVEYNQQVASVFERWRSRYPNRDIRLVPGRWEEVADQLGEFDAVFFDAYPTSEEEFQQTVIESITFAESFIWTAAAALRPGGVFTYYSNEIDSMSRRHQRLLLQHFDSFRVSVLDGLEPPDDCNYWWSDSMVIVSAYR